MIRLLAIGLFLFFSQHLLAQDAAKEDVKPEVAKPPEPPKPPEKKYSWDYEFKLELTSNVDKQKNDTTEVKTNTSLFNSARNRINFRTEVAPNLAFRTRIRFDKEKTDLAKDAAGFMIMADYMFVTHKIGDLALMIGKVPINSGSIEGSESSLDMYHNSKFVASFVWPWSSSAGVRAEYTVAKQVFALWSFNTLYGGSKYTTPAATATTNTGTAKKYNGDLAYGIQWRGDFNGIVKPIIGYTSVPHQPDEFTATATGVVTKSKKYFTNVTGVGTKILAGPATFHIEYDMAAEPEYDKVSIMNGTISKAKKVDVNAIVALYRHKFTPMVSTILKVTQDNFKLGGEKQHAVNGYSLALELRPEAESMFYYTVSYASMDDKYSGTFKDGGGFTQISSQYANVGVNARF
ncbi:MAG: hypothetical protein HQK54_06910 [Oligoflexales bacterium]|nr:hypothetical protein [Oligoflexales bacterium]